jgi:hypothetical protein
MLGDKLCNNADEEGKKWMITKRDIEPILEFAERSQRFSSRVTGEENVLSVNGGTRQEGRHKVM